MIYDYSYNVSTTPTLTTSDTTTGSITLDTTYHSTGDYWYPYYPYYTYYPYFPYTIPEPVRLYQIFCPKPGCNGKFWAEIGEVKPCPICKSKIKITDEPTDYEVAVIK